MSAPYEEIRSRFRLLGLLPMFFLLLFAIAFLAGLLFLDTEGDLVIIALYIFLFLFLLYVCSWVIFGELRTKAIKVVISNRQITIKRYLGIGAEKTYFLSHFEGFTTCQVPTKYDTWEYLYLMRGGKKMIKLSAYYHKNYAALKEAIAAELPFQGDIPFRLKDECREMFMRQMNSTDEPLR